MAAGELAGETARLDVEHIGGIEAMSLTLTPGVNVLTGRNATNRTSLLQAIMAACGSDRVSLKADADEGRVRLRLGGETYTRVLERRDGEVVTDGDPYLEDPTVADMFAFLLEANEARRSVERGDDLRELIMRPIDTEAIRAEIRELADEKRQLDRELEELDELERRRVRLEERRDDLTARIEEKSAELESQTADVDALDGRAVPELDDRLDELRETRAELEEVRYRIETEEESLAELRAEKADLEARREELTDPVAEGDDALDAEIDRLQDRQAELEAELGRLQNIVQFNEQLLEEDPPEDLVEQSEVTDRLVEDDRVVCWTCGTPVASEAIAETVDYLREVRREKFTALDEVESDLEARREERRRRTEQRQRREELEGRLDRIETDIADRESEVASLCERRDGLIADLECLEASVDGQQADEHGEIFDHLRAVTELEFELDDLRSEREEITTELAAVERRLETRPTLEARREAVAEDLADRRTRIEQIEENAVAAFNDHMAALIDRLEYENLARIWLERQTTGGDGTESAFRLHVVRTGESGATFEDTRDHLSESERELIGLAVALAGYLVHDVHETVPFMLLDSLEAIDSGRIADLVDYLEDHVRYLVVALLPEDAAALDDEHALLEMTR